MKKIICIAVLISSCVNATEPDVSFTSRCFISTDNKIKMRMLWMSNDGWSGGYVQYGLEKPKISIVQKKRTEEYLVEGRPPAVEVELIEVVDNKINGEYLLQYQGAVVDITYINKKGRRYIFNQVGYDYDDCFTAKYNK